MLIKPPSDIRSSEITDKSLYLNRREFMAVAGIAAGAGVAACAGVDVMAQGTPAAHGQKFQGVQSSPLSTNEKPNTWEQITTYNNYYEFGTDKDSPSQYARNFRTTPWTVAVEGECAKPAVYHLEDILKGQTLEDRIYRHRCVERWSMVIPWVGFPLSSFIKRCEPTGKAKFIEFYTLADAKQMPGLSSGVLPWPYLEGLRMDEAMHPLTILVVGLYGEVLPNQDGAPLRVHIPWKYGFKSIKSIVKIKLTGGQPPTTWNLANPPEYGFYSNVNPNVPNPRYSQAMERRLPSLFSNHPTQIFNGYSDQVASLYAGMDLRKNF